jgi:hypothetical protein
MRNSQRYSGGQRTDDPSATVGITMPISLIRDLNTEAERRNVNRATLARELIVDGLRRNKPQDAA